MLDEDSQLPIGKETMDKAARKPLSESFLLDVDMVRDAVNQTETASSRMETVVESSLMVEAADTERDVVVACLTRDDFIKDCHEVLQEVLEVMATLPRSAFYIKMMILPLKMMVLPLKLTIFVTGRTMRNLYLLKDFFATTSIFVELSHSNMIQRCVFSLCEQHESRLKHDRLSTHTDDFAYLPNRNLARFLGIQVNLCITNDDFAFKRMNFVLKNEWAFRIWRRARYSLSRMTRQRSFTS